MTRRPVLPGANELFRRTDTPPVEAEVTELPSLSSTASSPAMRGGAARKDDVQPLTLVPGGASAAGDDLAAFRTPVAPAPVSAPAIPTRGRPQKSMRADRTKHDEKITVYLSAEELLGLEGARLVLRGQHGVAADRGRIVREAVAVILADLEERGDESVLVRRLRGA
ncbi:hypothetical protein [Petropleomorpha daqingensis]|uniref:Cobyrinic acid a,c-diamide synthase n=1 Tax=Petropleomorpha daqingensis TaxID=2026353 RepID=A0A853CPA3_9ACTN|nr:hypothetical protein [Petropleomorpha daqingensis]